MTPSIRIKRPSDPLRPEIDLRLARRRTIAIERDIAKAAEAVNLLRDDIGYRGSTSAELVTAWAGASEGLS